MTYRSIGLLKQFVVTADVTATTTSATIVVYPAIVGPGSPYQNVDALPLAGADLTCFPGTAVNTSAHSGTQGLALTRDAFALVGVKIARPKAGSVELTSYARDPDSGIGIGFIRAFDPVQYKWINRFDCVFGTGNLYADSGAVRILGA
jgi:hypothetical protein